MNERVALLNLFVSSPIAGLFLFTLLAYTTAATATSTSTPTTTDI